MLAMAAGLFSNFSGLKGLLTNKLVWAGVAVLIAYFAGYNGAKTKFTNYAVVAALESEKAQLQTEYQVLLDSSKATAAQLAARTSLQIQQDKVISDFQSAIGPNNTCKPTDEFLKSLNELTGVIPE